MNLFAHADQFNEADSDSSWRSQLDFRKNYSLKKLAQKCILKNKRFFVLFHDDTKVNPFDQIYNFMRTDLIRLLKSDANSITDFWADFLELLLLNERVLTFSIVASTLHISKRIWSELAEKCPCLKQLSFRWHPYYPTLVYYAPVSPILNQLTQMQQLCVLEVDLAFDDDALCILAMSLPKLRVLQLQLSCKAVTKEGFFAISAMFDLREFIFWNKSTSSRWYLSEILEYLPGLNVVGCRLQAEEDVNVDHFTSNLREVLKIEQYSESSVPKKHQLQELELVNLSHMPKNLLFPKLKLLKLSGTYNDFSTDDFDLAKLTDLILKDMQCLDKFIPLLFVTGVQLRKLSLCFGSTRLQLEKVLNLCPNLEEFYVVPFSKKYNCFIIELTNDLAPLLKLRVLKITASVIADGNNGILSTLLKMMPNLQFLHLNLGSKLLMMDDLVLNLQNSVINLHYLKSLTVKLQTMNINAKMEWNRRVDYYSSSFVLQCPFLEDLNIEKASL